MSGTIPSAVSSRFSVMHAQRHFDVSTRDVLHHLKEAAMPSNRDFFGLLQKPDLYGALWVPASVSFATFALGNLTTWLRTNHDFEYNFASLVAAFVWLNLFVFGAPFMFHYLGCEHMVVNLMTLFGYSTFYIVPPALASVVLGKKFGFLTVLIGAAVGAYSVSRKTGGKGISALPGAPGRDEEKPSSFNRFGIAYFALHLIVHCVCFL
jgi:hypothetical protein